MGEHKCSKINLLERDLPEGLLVDAAWLEKRGYYPSLRRKYVELGWLVQPARSVYRRPRGSLTWQQVVISLQTLLEVPVIVGGRTALELQGYAHYVSDQLRNVHLYDNGTLPKWVAKLPIKPRFELHRNSRVFRNNPITLGLTSLKGNLETGEGVSGDPLQSGVTFQSWGQWDWPLTLSTPERAVLELLDELPNRESFHQVDMLVEGLSNLSPRRMQKMLADCSNVKVKRLFFYFADRHKHAWLAKLDKRTIDLGTGNRMLVRGGRLDPKYRITVPKDLDAVQ